MRATTQSPVETIEVEGRKIDINPDGYMIDRSLWTPAIAEALAARDGIQLTDKHWQILDFLQEYYHEYKISPNVRVLVKHLNERWGEDKVDRTGLYNLFPKGPAFQGTKIAGLPKPYDCIDG